MNETKYRMRLGAFRIRLECRRRRAAGLLKTGSRFQGTGHHFRHIRAGEPGCRIGERRVAVKCLLQQRGSLIYSLGVTAVISMTPAQIEVIGFGILHGRA